MNKKFIRATNGLIRRYLKKIDSSVSREFHPYYDRLIFQEKEYFDKLYESSVLQTGTPPSVWRKDRFLNLFFLAQSTFHMNGEVAECGSWKGLSSLVINGAFLHKDKNYEGEYYNLIDSFEGLSEPTEKDTKLDFDFKGKFHFPLEKLKENLSAYPKINYFKGWIPEVFKTVPEKKYKFVHIDVDLENPTVESFKYFYQRLVPGGIIVCDDYGSTTWLGMQKQVDIFFKEYEIQPFLLSTGQVVVIKKLDSV